jgi:hypothetical protein
VCFLNLKVIKFATAFISLKDIYNHKHDFHVLRTVLQLGWSLQLEMATGRVGCEFYTIQTRTRNHHPNPNSNPNSKVVLAAKQNTHTHTR